MKLLFVGNANSFLIIQLAKKLKEANPSWRIDILSSEEQVSDEGFDKVYALKNLSVLGKTRVVKVPYLARKYKQILRQVPDDYDAVHLLYASTIFTWVSSNFEKALITLLIGIITSCLSNTISSIPFDVIS